MPGSRLARIVLRDPRPHPSPLVESGPMASVAPPAPTYRPVLPPVLRGEGRISDAQAETAIYAGEAHRGYLPGRFRLGGARHEVTLARVGGQIAARAEPEPSGCPETKLCWRTPGGTGPRSGAEPRHRAALELEAGRCDPSGSWHPVHHLRHHASGRSRGGNPGSTRSSPGWVRISKGAIAFDEAHAMANAAAGGMRQYGMTEPPIEFVIPHDLRPEADPPPTGRHLARPKL